MSDMGWGDLPEGRQLARLGKRWSRAAQGRLQWMLFYYFNGRNAARTCRRFAISRQTFYRWKRRFDRHDVTTLGRALASAAQRAPAHLGARVSRTRFVSAPAVSALGQGQAGGAARPREVPRLHLHGGTHSGLWEAARGASRTAQAGPAAPGAAEIAKAAMGHSQA